MITLATAWEEGLRWFDTAPFYGEGRAERMVGDFLRGKPRHDYLLSTKVGRVIEDGDAVFDFSAEGIRRSIDASLERLGVDRFDVVFLHDPDDHLDQAVTDAWPAMLALRNDGVADRIGIGVTRVSTATELIERAGPEVLLLAERYTLLDPEAADRLFPLCQRYGVDVAIAGALSGGMIDGVEATNFHYQPLTPTDAARAAAIRRVCASYGVPTAAVALQFVLAHPTVTSVLTGPARAGQLLDNLGWLRTPVPAEVWQSLRRDGLLAADVPTPPPGSPEHQCRYWRDRFGESPLELNGSRSRGMAIVPTYSNPSGLSMGDFELTARTWRLLRGFSCVATRPRGASSTSSPRRASAYPM